ncbi:hypothetical protein M413DRAFT_13992 [Hebeloma cylindrosporum]|uniref:FAS1 domain-containing protein n=1 Tax=Hebeloma cylindrosporum TaxID=76867 RepID=A0A0C2XEG6_HEBCY|nr:hypothetical protein M413DRAFT_13992 [Hebeloma cylindrosporum h7]
MRFAVSLLLPLLSFLSPAHAQGNSSAYSQAVVAALQQAGFTGLAGVLTTINSTAPAQTLFSELSSGRNFTLFAPDDESVGNLTTIAAGNNSLLAEYVTYHFINGNFQNFSANVSAGGPSGGGCSFTPLSTSTVSTSASAMSAAAVFERRQISSNTTFPFPQIYSGVFPNVTLGRTLLNASDLVMLEGNKSQVLAWTRNETTLNVTILNQAASNVTIVNATTWQNLFINGISGFLTPPGNLTNALTATNASDALCLLTSTHVISANGTNETIIEAIQEARGITLFIPNNASFTTEVNQTISGLLNNQTALATLLQNHYINGTTLYSTQIANQSNVTTAAGEPIQFLSNSSGLFLEGANGTSAQVVRPDVLLDNGVAHIIDRVLIVEDSNPSAASSAYASATSEAAISTTETAPIGLSTSSSSETSSSASTSSSETSTSTTSGTSTITVTQTASV